MQNVNNLFFIFKLELTIGFKSSHAISKIIICFVTILCIKLTNSIANLSVFNELNNGFSLKTILKDRYLLF